MSTKELAMETIRGLPEDASWHDIEERIRFLAAIEKGREEVRKGAVVPHEDVRELLRAWTTE
jgi:predicted transcriptional regulator